MEIIKVADLADHLEDPSLTASGRAQSVVKLTNELITEKWKRPVAPIPASVTILAYTVAARALGVTPGRGRLGSLTRTSDGTSRTERYENTGAIHPDGRDVFLTDDELRDLNPPTRRRPRTVRTHVPGMRW